MVTFAGGGGQGGVCESLNRTDPISLVEKRDSRGVSGVLILGVEDAARALPNGKFEFTSRIPTDRLRSYLIKYIKYFSLD